LLRLRPAGEWNDPGNCTNDNGGPHQGGAVFTEVPQNPTFTHCSGCARLRSNQKPEKANEIKHLGLALHTGRKKKLVQK
jgi:hypothetical protein